MAMADNNNGSIRESMDNSSIVLSPSFDFSVVIIIIMSTVAIFGNLGTVVA